MLSFNQKILSLIDLTSLNDTDTEASIHAVCQRAVTPFGHTAAVCIFPQFVKLAATQLKQTPVNIATVANFPAGSDPVPQVLQEIKSAIQHGAQEIDVVLPSLDAQEFVKACKKACGKDVILKVILETGKLSSSAEIAAASESAIRGGADFIKTSTGKISPGATIQAAEIMLQTIKTMSKELNRTIGFKAAGGIRTIEQAREYIDIAERIMGKDWVTPKTFRIGASQLYEALFNI